ncbi:MAG: hypothetical protein PVSMB5_38480 [Ktedonobacteraceae bacterium]
MWVAEDGICQQVMMCPYLRYRIQSAPCVIEIGVVSSIQTGVFTSAQGVQAEKKDRNNLLGQ